MKSKYIMRFSYSLGLLVWVLSACSGMSSPSKSVEANPNDVVPKSDSSPVAEQQPKIDVLKDVLFPQIYSVIKQYYVEEPNQELMIQGAINGMLSALDPHSSYMGP